MMPVLVALASVDNGARNGQVTLSQQKGVLYISCWHVPVDTHEHARQEVRNLKL